MVKNAKALSVAFLFDDTLDSTAGVAQYVKAMGAWLAHQGHQVSYLVGETKLGSVNGSPVYSLSKNLKVRFNANRVSVPLPSTNAAKIKQVLAKEKPDVLYVQTPFSPFMSARVIARAPKSSAVIGSFNILPAGRLSHYGAHSLRLLLLPSLNRMDQMLATSPPAAKFAERAFGLPAMVSPNVIDLKRFDLEPKPHGRAQPQRIIFLGRLVERKGAKELLQAFHRAFKGDPKVRLTLAGAGPQASWLRSYVQQHKLDKVVDFPGFVAEDAKAALLAKADIACFPSLFGESFGISLLEGMAAARGVVLGGDNPGYRSVLGQQPKLLVDPRDELTFSQRLVELLNDKALVEKLHQWQRHEVKRYDVEEVGPQLVEIFQRTIAKRPQPR